MYIKQSKRTKKNQKKRATLGAQEEKKIYKKQKFNYRKWQNKS